MKAFFATSFSFTKLLIVIVFALLAVSQLTAQNSKNGKVSWKALGDKDNEFVFSIPDGFEYFDDGEIYVGTESNFVKVKNKKTIARYINGSVLLLNIYEGDADKIQSALNYIKKEIVNETTTTNGFQIKSYIYKAPDFVLEQQHIFDDDSLYLLSAYYRSERTNIVDNFFKSVRLFKDKKGVAPNFPKGATKAEILAPLDDVTIDSFSDEVVENPDKPAIIIYRSRPAWRTEFGRSNSGDVKLNLLLSSSGKVLKVKTVFAPTVGLADSVKPSAEHSVFLPAIKDGKPVSTWKTVEYGFEITTTGL